MYNTLTWDGPGGDGGVQVVSCSVGGRRPQLTLVLQLGAADRVLSEVDAWGRTATGLHTCGGRCRVYRHVEVFKVTQHTAQWSYGSNLSN